LIGISPATIDRLLCPVRIQYQKEGYATTPYQTILESPRIPHPVKHNLSHHLEALALLLLRKPIIEEKLRRIFDLHQPCTRSLQPSFGNISQ
jgi:hypothetical protein